ncbi:unnamed protein product [Psylliodes chrysocephalus]|uniref:phospholipase A2 n=1 Tax=Psylliodes chrysocephalus TaxID=3402493 RepID=A0A9P0CW01_9CUCU|nr:unnamed protein product [Psylliodes chrysocephala]
MILIQNLVIFIFFYVATGLQYLGGHFGDGITYPGTKWCGIGNIASDDNDFGTEIEADKCCQTHSNCPDYIEGFQTKYNLTNPLPYSSVLCKCDKELNKCLKEADTEASNDIGDFFFNKFISQCFSKQGDLYHWEDKPKF